MNPRKWTGIDFGLLVLLVAVALFATRPVWLSVFTTGLRDDEQSHVLMALPLAVWLAWVRRAKLRRLPPRWSLIGPLLIGIGLLGERWGFAAGIDVARHLGALLIVVGAAVTVTGVQFVRRLYPAFAALLFLLPVPGRLRQQIAIPLQEASAKTAHFFMDLFGVAVTRSGNVLAINGQEVAIAEACNGMRMVAALALVAFAFVYSVPMRNSVRVLILALSPFIAVLVNAVRLIPTVLMYGYASVEAADLFHDLMGWAVLLLALGFLWALFRLLRWIEVPVDPYPVATG